MNLFLVLAAALLVPQEKEKEVDELLEKVERALISKIPLQLTCQSELRYFRVLKSGGAQVLRRVSQVNVELNPGHRVRIDGLFPADGLTWATPVPRRESPPVFEDPSACMTLTSDGKTIDVGPYYKPPAVSAPVPAGWNRALIRDFVRLGVHPACADAIRHVALPPAVSARETDDLEATVVGREELEGKPMVKIQFKSPRATGPASPVTFLWIDAKTHVPVRRESRTAGTGWEKVREESYSIQESNRPIEP